MHSMSIVICPSMWSQSWMLQGYVLHVAELPTEANPEAGKEDWGSLFP